MIPELGHLALILALVAAAMLALIPYVGLQTNRTPWMQAGRYYAFAQFLFVSLAYIALTVSFLQDDFSLRYVVNHSSLSLPWFYKLCAVWGGHEGSMLLWVAILCTWTVLVASFSKSLDVPMRARVLVILGLLNVGFILFLLSTSNPFLRDFAVRNVQGRDLNPLLQDPGFLFHPPMLYMGYVGFCVAFAFAIAALWAKEVASTWSKWTRPWTLAAWCCLTTGITLGSWWAYRELGWGGWWFWDPVENASFMPWLMGTALIHSLAVVEQRQQFKAWTMLLAISTFSLSLIGTFLVRSGVLTSVHAFAVDPQRGLYILGFLTLVIGGSLVLFMFRATSLHSDNQPEFLSRGSALLLNNVLLITMVLTLLLGTVYPLLVDALGLDKLSVGAPYFNAVFIPLMLPMLLLMGLAVHLPWRRASWSALLKDTQWVAGLAVILPTAWILCLGKGFDYKAWLGLVLASWVLMSTAVAVYKKIKSRGLFQVNQAFWGMVLAHCGVAVTAVGITVSNGYGVQQDVQMRLGDVVDLAGYKITFISQAPLQGANYYGTRANFTVTHHGKRNRIYPEKRQYTVAKMAMTEAAIDVTPFRDIYVALGEPLGKNAWSVRLYYKPCIRWIWTGGLMIAVGGLLALTDRRYFQKRKVGVGVTP